MTNPQPVWKASEKLKALLLKSKTRQGCPFSPLLLNTVVLEVVATAVRSEKDIKGIQIGRKNLNCPYMQMTWFSLSLSIYAENPKDLTQKLLEVIN